MTTRTEEQPAIGSIVVTILGVAAALILPSTQWSLIGWINILLPLLAFTIFGKFGDYVGRRVSMVAAIIALVGHLIIGGMYTFLFSVVTFFPGYVLYCSASKQESPAWSGLKGSLALFAGWMIVSLLHGLSADVSFYGQLLETLDKGFTDTLEYYRSVDRIAADSLVILENTISQIKAVTPFILPGIIGSLIVSIIWLSMACGNIWLKKSTNRDVWPKYHLWQLPERLIWGVIAMAALALIPVSIFRLIGSNGLILLSVVYCFQGLSITMFFLHKWNVPLLLRLFFYMVIVFQSLGSILLVIIGLADIWFDFRKLKKTVDVIVE